MSILLISQKEWLSWGGGCEEVVSEDKIRWLSFSDGEYWLIDEQKDSDVFLIRSYPALVYDSAPLGRYGQINDKWNVGNDRY